MPSQISRIPKSRIKFKIINSHKYIFFNIFDRVPLNLELNVELQVDQAATQLSERNDPASQKVHVAVYYEALCPDSRSFILKQLAPTYRKLLANMELELVPYGKAKVRKFVATNSRRCY